MKVAIYSRTSTSDQSLVNQSMVLTDWAFAGIWSSGGGVNENNAILQTMPLAP